MNSLKELLTASPEELEIFQLQIPYGRPAPTNLFYSLCVHAAIVTALFNVTLPDPRPLEIPPVERISPTELRLEGHLYYVSQIPASTGQTPQTPKKTDEKFDPTKLTLPRAAESGKMAPPPKPAPVIDLPKPPELAIKSQAPATPAASSQLAATRNLVQRILARTFVPPEVKRTPAATQTLIQPLSPPDLVPKPTPLPSFRVSSPQFPKIPKPFLAPGRKIPTPPAQVPNVPVPNIEMVHADPVLASATPKLPLPATPPPPDPVPSAVEGPAPAPQGDAVSILSLSDRPVPLDKRVVVPAGNIAQESGEAAAAQAGSPAGAAAAGANNAAPNPASSASATSATASAAAGRNAQQNPVAGAPQNTGSGTVNLSGTNPQNTGASTGAGTGRGTVGTGPGAALAGASPTGSLTAVAGSITPAAGANNIGPNNNGAPTPATGNGAGTSVNAGAGAGSGNGRVAAGQVINRPPGGTYDAVVIQSSPVDQYPESRGLLSGRPIYSVYISAGSARDWTLYFCVPNEKPPSTNSPVVQIDAPQTPVKAPYAYKLVRPIVTLPTFEKYVLVHGYVTADGHFQSLKIVRAILPEVDNAILAAMADWEFRAATKDGVPIQVEFLLSIPAKGL